MRRAAILGVIAFAAAVRAERLPLQQDFGRCASAMLNAGHAADLQGQLRLQLLIRRDGRVYAAFVGGSRGIGNVGLMQCVVSPAVLWEFPPVAIDYERSYAWLSFTPPTSDSLGSGGPNFSGARSTPTQGAVMMPHLNDPPPEEPLDYDLGRKTLDIGEFATPAERGLARLAVQEYPAAIKAFRDTLASSPDDPEALRGLAQALAESKGDLREARSIAERLLRVAPQSVAGHEAMIRVCLVQRDTACVFDHWKPALASADFGPRSRMFKVQLEPKVRQLAQDAQGGAPGQAADQAQAQGGGSQRARAQQDECAGAHGDQELAVCMVRRCLDAGSAQYAKELSEQNKIQYVAGQWQGRPAGAGKVLVSRPIAAQGDPASHRPMWLVKLGEQVTMQPTNAEARQITLTHNACAARVNAGK